MNHYDSQDFEEDDLIDAAIQGLTTGTKDEYTSYFPPVENRAFQS
jgi:C-terminal processing protease CtpA/Prc